MSQEQFARFKNRGWEQTRVPRPTFNDGKKDSVPEQYWRKVRETIFPDSNERVLEDGTPQTVRALDSPAISPAETPAHDATDGPVMMSSVFGRSDSLTLMSREDRAKRMRELNQRLGRKRAPRRAWETADYKSDHIVSDLPELAPLHSDSLFQSMKRDTKERLSLGVPEEGPFQANEVGAEQSISKSPTDYDIFAGLPGLSMPAGDRDDLKAELLQKLYNDLRLIDPTFDCIERLNDALLPLVHSFALRMGLIGLSKAEEEIMLLFYRSRKFVHSPAPSRIYKATDLRLVS
ncbi:hypothetical protein NW768_011290 [Fusarium equiseti]|uniref:Uncharacterized protein n=1 Tax=Fusarium equiseti TaxID=61235 RepID=A0ABQ8QY03_FUSEQ|nr:hypothetical protein NW768_011290 [Fusarium equiseti]